MTRLQARSVLFVALVAVSLVILALGQAGYLDGPRRFLLSPFAALQRGLSNLAGGAAGLLGPDPDAEALRQRNAALEAQVAELQAQVVQLQESQADLDLLAGLLDFRRSQPQLRTVAANVISRDTSPFLSYVIIDVGSDDGVRREMPVVTAEGLVGQVVETSCCAAKVRLIIDPASAVNARLQASRDEGVAVGQLAGGLELQFLSQQAQLRPGDRVVTSGLGGTYPPGLVIGTISGVQRLDYEVLQKATLAPGAALDRLEIVLVITDFEPLDLEPFFQATEPAP